VEFHTEFVHLGPLGEKDAESKGFDAWEKRQLKDKLKARVVLGHNVKLNIRKHLPGENIKFITI